MEAMDAYGHGREYSNFAERAVYSAAFYPDLVYARLRDVRSRVEPDGLMRANREIG